MAEGKSTPRVPDLAEALRESEERFRRAFEFAGIGMAILSIDGRWVRVNRALTEMLGYTAAEFQETTFQALTHPNDMEGSVAGSLQVVSGREPIMQMEKRYRHKAGHYVWTRLTTSVVRSPEGEPLHYISQIEDIDARKHAEAARHAIEVRLTTLVDHAPDGIFIHSQEHIVYANPAGAKLFGAPSPDDLLGRSFMDLTHADFRSITARRMQNLMDGAPLNPPIVVTYVRIDGTPFEAEVQSVPFPVEAGGGALVFMRDIAERRRLESHLHQLQKMEGIGLLAGGIAHDFNNILAVMTLQLGMLLGQSGLAEPAREALRDLEEQAGKAAGLIRQLLMFSRRSLVSVTSLDLNHVVEHVLKMLTRLLGETIDIEFEPNPTIGAIEADVGMIEQVVMNLAVNARDAMPRGGLLRLVTGVAELGAPEAAKDPKRRPGRFTTLTVTDTGAGMDAATLERIFDPFFTTKAPGHGTGLGLATVYGIVEQHRGWLEVTSSVGKGTTVELFFPMLRGARPAATGSSSARGGTDALATTPVPKTILLVEDEDVVRRVLARCLRGAGYAVLESASATDAIALWRSHADEVDLLFTDMMMPGAMNGLDLAVKILHERPSVRVIICSGYSLEMQAQGKPTDPRIGYLAKPFELATLWDIVRDYINRP